MDSFSVEKITSITPKQIRETVTAKCRKAVAASPVEI